MHVDGGNYPDPKLRFADEWLAAPSEHQAEETFVPLADVSRGIVKATTSASMSDPKHAQLEGHISSQKAPSKQCIASKLVQQSMPSTSA